MGTEVKPYKAAAPSINEYKDYHLKLFGVYSKNSTEYIVLDGAAALYGLTSVPIYDTLGEEACEHMFAETNLATLFTTCDHVNGIVTAVKQNRCGKVTNLVIMDEQNFNMELKDNIESTGTLKYYLMSQLMENGRKSLRPYAKVDPDHIYTFSYTSGTTSTPKGTMLSHRNVMTMVGAVQHCIKVDGEIRHVSYLPLAHIFERIILNMVLARKGKYGIFNGNVLKLSEDLIAMKPTVFVSVPRLYNKFYDGIKAKINGMTGFSRSMVDRALAAKEHYLTTTGNPYHSFWDRLVFNKMKQRVGGCVQIMMTASAPIDRNVLRF